MEEESFFANVPHEGQNPEEFFDGKDESVDKELEVETPAESQTEKEEEPDLKANNTWKEMREQLDSERNAREELAQRLAEIESKGKDEAVEQPEFLTKMIGQNDEVAKDYKDYEQSLKEKIKAELIQDQLDAQKKEQEQKDHWDKWTADRLTEVEQEFKVDFKANESVKNELSKIMLDYTPTDEQGNLDYKKGMKILLALKKDDAIEQSQKTQAKKNIADASISKETSSKETKDYLTRKDMAGGWRSMVNKDY